jgi:hypothetical protein
VPSRDEVVEYLREVLQPLYDDGRLPTDAFVKIIRHVSHRLAEWSADAGHRDASWRGFLHAELEKLLGDGWLL